jgi:hypothetical protein
VYLLSVIWLKAKNYGGALSTFIVKVNSQGQIFNVDVKAERTKDIITSLIYGTIS